MQDSIVSARSSLSAIRKILVQAGDPEDLQDPLVGADQRDAAIQRLDPFQETDNHLENCCVAPGALFKVQRDPADLPPSHLHDRASHP
jgi:hypothetical protein